MLATADGLDGGLHCLAVQSVVARDAAGVGLVVAQREQDHLAGDELVAALLRFPVGEVQQRPELATDLHFAAGAADFRQALERALEGVDEAADIHAGALQQRTAAAFALIQQRRQQMDGIDVLVVIANGETLGVRQRFLQLGGEFVDTHWMGSGLVHFAVIIGPRARFSRLCAGEFNR